MSEPQGQKPRIELSLGSTKQVGEFEFAKCFVSMSRDLEPGEDPRSALKQIEGVLSEFLFTHIRKTTTIRETPKVATAPALFGPELVREIEGLPWERTSGKPGREFIRIEEHEERIMPLLVELRLIDPSAYLKLGGYSYRIEGSYVARYPRARVVSGPVGPSK